MINLVNNQFLNFNLVGTLVIPLYQNEKLPDRISKIDDKSHNIITSTLKNSLFSGQAGQVEVINSPYNLNINKIILIGLGDENDKLLSDYRKAGSALTRILKKYPVSDISLYCNHLSINACNKFAFHFLETTWTFSKYKTTTQPKEVYKTLTVIHEASSNLEPYFRRTHAIIDGLFYAKSLVAETPSNLTPQIFAQKCKELENMGITVEILDAKELSKLQMNCLLGAAKGSENPPFVVIMKYNNKNGTNVDYAFVGKGVCFDSGGLSLKPYKHMYKMHYDMAGAAAVVGSMIALAKQKFETNVIGIIGLIENMPNGDALKPGDVIYSMSGKTVEIVSTDAEGRLVLADCLYYVEQRFKPKNIIDLATLTPETFASLGIEYGGLFCEEEELKSRLMSAGNNSGDLLWPLPMGEYFKKQIISKVADIKNLGVEFEGENGAAAEFLKQFVSKSNWAHLDIGGVGFKENNQPNDELTVSGYGVKLLEELVFSEVNNVNHKK